MEVASLRPVLALIVSTVGAILLFLTGNTAFYRKLWSLLASLLMFVIVISMLQRSLQGVIFITRLFPLAPNIRLELRVDALGIFFALVSSTLWLITMIYTLGYMESEDSQARFFGFFALSVSSVVGIAFASNLLTLFVFSAILTVCTYPLIVHHQTPEALSAGGKYLLYTLAGEAIILFSIIVTFYLARTTTLSKQGILSLDQGKTLLSLLFFLYIIGFGVKAVIMPLHNWLVTATIAPVPVNALLHAIAVTKAGAFGILRVIYNVYGVGLVRQLGIGSLLAYLATITIIGGSLLALRQDNLKRRLAYSTVSQISYIILGVALLTPLAAIGSIIHLANQAFQKITLFFCAGAIERQTGKEKISEMAGIGYKMPITMGAFTIACLGFIGLPLLAGFITVWHLSLGAFRAGKPIFIIVLLVSTILNAAYWFPIIYQAYFKESSDDDTEVREAHWTLLYPTVICALYVIGLGTLSAMPGLPLSVVRAAVQFIFKGL